MFFNQNIIFKQKTIEESAFDLCRRFYMSKNPFWRRTLKGFLKKDKPTLQDFKDRLKLEYNTKRPSTQMLDGIRTFWKNNESIIVKELEGIFGAGKVAYQKVLCFLGMSPYMMVDYANSTISFPIYNPLSENINYFISFLIKYTIIDNLWDEDCLKINIAYSKDSAYWIMSDFVADAICYHSSLPCFAIKPAFPFYYSLVIKGENVIYKFRRLYKTMNIYDFMKYVLNYVQSNASIFSQFTHRL